MNCGDATLEVDDAGAMGEWSAADATAHGRPKTTNVERIDPFQVFVAADETGQPFDGKAQAEQVRAIDVERLRPGALGALSAERLRQLDEALRQTEIGSTWHRLWHILRVRERSRS